MFGILADNIWVLWESFRLYTGFYDSTYYGPYGDSFHRIFTEPLLWHPYFFLSNFIEPTLLWNSILCLFLILNVIFSYKFFKHFFSEKISSILSFLWILSPYFSYHAREHLSLTAAFFIPMFLEVTFFYKETIKKHIILGLISGIALLFTNYLGFFLFFTYGLYYLTYILLNRSLYDLINFGKNSVIYGSIFLVFTSYLFTLNTDSAIPIVDRPVEDFFSFSARPWFYLLPPEDNLLTGFKTADIIYKIQSSSPLWLTKDYFKSEHTTLYIGIFNLILGLPSIFYFVKTKNKEKISILSLLLLMIVFTLPPFIVIKGVTFYLPSYFIYEFAPAIRVLSRLGIFIYLLFLIFVGYGLKYFYSKSFFKIFLMIFMGVSILDLYIPYKFSISHPNPQLFDYLKNEIPYESQLIIFPYSKVNDILYFTYYHQKPIVNPRGYTFNNFSSEDFTKNLTCEKIKTFLSPVYLVSYDMPLVKNIELESFNLVKIIPPYPDNKKNNLLLDTEVIGSNSVPVYIYKFTNLQCF